jgi:hypothetical protein
MHRNVSQCIAMYRNVSQCTGNVPVTQYVSPSNTPGITTVCVSPYVTISYSRSTSPDSSGPWYVVVSGLSAAARVEYMPVVRV